MVGKDVNTAALYHIPCGTTFYYYERAIAGTKKKEKKGRGEGSHRDEEHFVCGMGVNRVGLLLVCLAFPDLW